MLRLLVVAMTVLAAAASAAAQAPDGARLFQRCFACHSLDPRETNLSGPTLSRLFGRRAGTLSGFEYSQAMREAGRRGLVWSEETLDRFLEDPGEFVPGAGMAGVRLRDPGERGAFIRWLKRAAE